MRKIIWQILVGLLLTISISAQTEEQKPILIDEWGKMNLEETMARLEYLTSELSKNPNEKAHIKIYGGEADNFSRPYLRGSLITAYLKNNLKLAAETFSIEYCNVNKEGLRTQLFILPQNEQFPKCEENLETPTNTVLFETVYFYSPRFKLTPLENSYIDIGPSEGEYSEVSLSILKRLSNNSPENKVYVIAYLQTHFEENEDDKIIAIKPKSLDKKSLAKRMIQIARNELIKKGFKSSQIGTIDGGYVNDERRLEFWFVPKGGEIPKPNPDYFPKQERSKTK